MANRIGAVVDDERQRQTGFIKVGREWFEYRVQKLETADGSKLVTSFYVVVEGDEALELHTARSVDVLGNPREHNLAAYVGDSAVVAEFLRDRDVLPDRAFAIEGSPDDPDGSLLAAVVAFRRRIRWQSARVMRLERMAFSLVKVMPAEKANDKFQHPEWSGFEPLNDYLERTWGELDREDGPNLPDHEESRPPRRTIEQLLADLRKAGSLDGPALVLEPSTDPAALVRLFGEELMEQPAKAADRFRATLLHVHRVGILGRDVFASVNADAMAQSLLERLPHVMVSKWEPSCQGGQPVIRAEYRFAAHPLAPRTRVGFTIAYQQAVDGTEDLVYSVSEIEEEEAQDL